MKSVSVAAIAVCLISGCLSGGGSTVPPPVATDVYLDVPDTAAVSLDGLYLGVGSRPLVLLANWPNYLQVDSWKMVIWSCGGLDTLALRGAADRVPVPVLHPDRVAVP